LRASIMGKCDDDSRYGWQCHHCQRKDQLIHRPRSS
jgi:hypothetical protein